MRVTNTDIGHFFVLLQDFDYQKVLIFHMIVVAGISTKVEAALALIQLRWIRL